MTARLPRRALPVLAVALGVAAALGPVDTAGAAMPRAVAAVAAVRAESPTPSPSLATSGSATVPGVQPSGGQAAEGSADSTGTECQGATDPQIRVFGITAASNDPKSGRVAPDQRTRFAYTNIPAGSAMRDYVGFVNKSCFPVTLTIYAADAYNSKDRGGLNILETGRKSKDLGAWVQIGGGSTITVAPRSTAIRQFVLTVPKGASPGDHSGAIIAATKPEPPTTSAGVPAGQVATEYRVGARLQVRVAGTVTPGLTVTGLTAEYHQGSNPLWGGSAHLTYSVRNTGNISVSAPQTVKISGLFSGTTEIKGAPKVEELLPGGEALFSADAPNLFPLDFATASVSLSPTDLDGKPIDSLGAQAAEADFLALSWVLLLIILLLLAGGGFLLWRWLRQRNGGRPSGPAEAADGVDDEVEIINYAQQAAGPVGQASRVAAGAGAWARRPLAVLGAMLAAVTVLCGAGLFTAAQALADETGTLTFIPATGEDVTPMWMVTSAPCPSDTKIMMGWLNGGSFPQDTIALGATTAGIRTDVLFGTALSDTFFSLAAQNNIKITAGDYRLSLLCLDYDQSKILRRFDGSVKFTDATHYTATAPAQPPAKGVPIGILSYAYPKNEQVQSAAIGQGLTPPSGAVTPSAATPGPSASPSIAFGEDTNVRAANKPVRTAGTSASGSDVDGTWVAIGICAAVIAALIGFRFLGGRRAPDDTVPFDDRVDAEDEELEHAWPDRD